MASEHRPQSRRRHLIVALVATLASGTVSLSCDGNLVPSEAAANPSELPAALPPVIAARIRDPQMYPCMQCHKDITPTVGKVAVPLKGPHNDIKFVHFKGSTDCSICHDPKNMDVLRLLTGEPVPIEGAYKVCGGCHGIKARDWEVGAHGKQVGSWQREGVKNRYDCTDCHNAHAPKFPQMHAKPPLPIPKFHIPKGGNH